VKKKANLHEPRLRRPWFDISYLLLTIAVALAVPVAWFLHPGAMAALLAGGAVLYLGFGLPRFHNRRIANQRAREAKRREKQKWGFCSRDREGPWINYIDYPLVVKAACAVGKRFYSEWLIVHDGYVVVNPGPSIVDRERGSVKYDFSSKRAYAWDGCTPKRWFFWVALLGTPDWGLRRLQVKTVGAKGEIETKDVLWQKAHHASLVHDAFYQYLDTVPVAKRDVDKLFNAMLKESGFSPFLAKIYHLAVRFFGAADVGEDEPGDNSALQPTGLPLGLQAPSAL